MTKRNTDLANHYSTQGITDYTQIMKDLAKNQGYRTATQADQETTAKSIFNMMKPVNQNPPTDTTVPTTPTPPADTLDQAQIDTQARFIKDYNWQNVKNQSATSNFLRVAMANQATIDKERDKFTNWDEVNGKVTGVIDAIARNKQANDQKGV